MPMIDLTLPQNLLDAEQRTALVDELTTALLRAERAPDTEFFRSITWAFVHELPPADVYAAGRPVAQPIIRLDVTTPEGALSDRRRGELVGAATQAIREATGIPEDEALRVWVICHEVPEGSWGAGGAVVQFRALRAASAKEKERIAAS
jgi:phenylpyruvate tautomerase PptA (4-oxalocrotonate tautomerase family)